MGRECTQCGYARQKDNSRLGRWEQDGMRFHHISQNAVQFKSYELFLGN